MSEGNGQQKNGSTNGTNGHKPKKPHKTAYRRFEREDFDNFIKLRLAGKSVAAAAKAVGFCADTVYEYQYRNPDEAERYKKEMRAVCVEAVLKAAKTQWQAAAWMLERCFPKEFALRTVNRVEHSGSIDHNVKEVKESRLIRMHELAAEVASQKPRIALN